MYFTGKDKIWVFSDPHYSHANLCIGSTKWDKSKTTAHLRQFNNELEMNEKLVDNLNEVGVNDHLFCLGDWTFGGNDTIAEFRSKIKCRNLYLILGNHDKDLRKHKYQAPFTKVVEYMEINVAELHFNMFHYPIESWNRMRHGSYMLFGHQHSPADKRIRNGKKMDVGLDGNDLKPYRLEEVINLLKDQPVLFD